MKRIKDGSLGIKIMFVSSIIIFLFGLFGENIIARLSPDYKKLNKRTVAQVYREINKDNIHNIITTFILNIKSNEFYAENKDLANTIALLGLVLFVIALDTGRAKNMDQLRDWIKSLRTREGRIVLDESGNLRKKNKLDTEEDEIKFVLNKLKPKNRILY